MAPPRTLGEFLYDAFVADTVTVYGNTVHLAPNPRGYTVVGFFFANLVGVRGVSDAFSDHDAADAHEQSGAERAIDGVFGTIGLVCTALPLAKPAASAISGPGAKATGTAAGTGQIAGSADEIATTAGKVGGDGAEAAASNGAKGVAIVGRNGKLGEFDEIIPGQFIEDKAGATAAIEKGLKFSGKTFDEAVSDWAKKNIFEKTKVRIENLKQATATMAEEGGDSRCSASGRDKSDSHHPLSNRWRRPGTGPRCLRTA